MDPDSGNNGHVPDLDTLDLAHEEARDVLNHQIDLLDDIVEKALQIVRLSGLILGLVISAASLSGDPFQFVNAWSVTVDGFLII